LCERRLTELLVLDVQDRAEILADALAVLYPHSLIGRLDDPAIGTVDDDPQNAADRFPAQLHVEDLEPVTPGNALGGLANPPDPLVVSGHARLKKGPQKQRVGTGPLGTFLEAGTKQYNMRLRPASLLTGFGGTSAPSPGVFADGLGGFTVELRAQEASSLTSFGGRFYGLTGCASRS